MEKRKTIDGEKARPLRGGAAPKALGLSVARVTRPLLGKRGFADGSVVARWAEIVGPLLARHTLPIKIAFPRGERDHGTLHLKVDGGAFATELQHLQPLLIERVNGFFGYRAVDAVRLAQGPLPEKPADGAPEPPPLTDEAEAALTAEIAGVSDPELKESLTRLGRAMKRRAAAATKT